MGDTATDRTAGDSTVPAVAAASSASGASGNAVAFTTTTKAMGAAATTAKNGSVEALERERSKTQRTKKHKKHYFHRDKNKTNGWVYKDSLTVNIPLNTKTTVDLDAVLQQCRSKYLEAIYQRYPQLRPASSVPPPPTTAGTNRSTKHREDKTEGEDLDDEMEDVSSEGGGSSSAKAPKKNGAAAVSAAASAVVSNKTTKKHPKHVPQPRDYGNMLEYLEAKYVQGVMVDHQDIVQGEDVEEGATSAGDEAGSVYSEMSDFIDDTDLQRTVANQVLAHSTATKVELARSSTGGGGEEDGGDQDEFFVNVGNLEVEESEYTKDHYDPLQDVDKKKLKVTKKRKKPEQTSTTVAVSSSSAADKSKTKAKASDSPAKSAQPKKKAKTAEPEKPSTALGKKKNIIRPKSKPTSAESSDDVDSSDDDGATSKHPKKGAPSPDTHRSAGDAGDAAGVCDAATLKAAALERKEVVDEMYDRIVQMIPNEQFPKRKTKDKVALICPADKKPGDSILFSNPHVPGQRLKVQIPKNTQPGGSFKVTVPVKEELDDAIDYNKLSREFYDLVDDYARAYDDWCDAHGLWLKAQDRDSEYTAHFEKRKKFDALLLEFPKDLKTPVDKEYMKKILRRARQNRSKREQTALRHQDHISVNGDENDDSGGGGGLSAPSSPTKPTIKPQIRKPSLTNSAINASVKVSSANEPPTKTKPVIVPSLARAFAKVRFHPKDFE